LKHKHKIIIIASILLFLIPGLAYCGHGKFGIEQVNIENICKNWKTGDKLPEYLLEDDSKFNPMSMHTPSYYILKIYNVELLWVLLSHIETPYSNFNTTALHLLDIVGVKKFKKSLKEWIPNSINNNMKRIVNNFNGKCLKVYYLFIDKNNIEFE